MGSETQFRKYYGYPDYPKGSDHRIFKLWFIHKKKKTVFSCRPGAATKLLRDAPGLDGDAIQFLKAFVNASEGTKLVNILITSKLSPLNRMIAALYPIIVLCLSS